MAHHNLQVNPNLGVEITAVMQRSLQDWLEFNDLALLFNNLQQLPMSVDRLGPEPFDNGLYHYYDPGFTDNYVWDNVNQYKRLNCKSVKVNGGGAGIGATLATRRFPGAGNVFYRKTHHRYNPTAGAHCIVHYRNVIEVPDAVVAVGNFDNQNQEGDDQGNQEEEEGQGDQDNAQETETETETDESIDDIIGDPDYIPSDMACEFRLKESQDKNEQVVEPADNVSCETMVFNKDHEEIAGDMVNKEFKEIVASRGRKIPAQVQPEIAKTTPALTELTKSFLCIDPQTHEYVELDKEFLALAQNTQDYLEQEKMEMRRQTPYHMHINLELVEAIDKLIAQGINAADVKKLQDAGIHTCNGLITSNGTFTSTVPTSTQSKLSINKATNVKTLSAETNNSASSGASKGGIHTCNGHNYRSNSDYMMSGYAGQAYYNREFQNKLYGQYGSTAKSGMGYGQLENNENKPVTNSRYTQEVWEGKTNVGKTETVVTCDLAKESGSATQPTVDLKGTETMDSSNSDKPVGLILNGC